MCSLHVQAVPVAKRPREALIAQAGAAGAEGAEGTEGKVGEDGEDVDAPVKRPRRLECGLLL